MKAGFLYVAIFALLLLVVPMIAMNFELDIPPEVQAVVDSPPLLAKTKADGEQTEGGGEDTPDQPQWQVVSPEEEAAADLDEPEYPVSAYGVTSFRILDETTGEVAEVGLRDFVRGAVAAEMPVSFHTEALKAQAVAAHTYALHNHLVQQENPDTELKGADFSADPANLKVYMTEEDAKAFYGESAERSWNKICAAADAVLDYVLEYDDEPIVAAYHAISAGQTEDASNVWIGSAPYLQPAESEGDPLAPGFESTVKVTAEELAALLEKHFPEIALGDDPAHWLGEPDRSSSGYVTDIQVGDGVLQGKDIRQLLDLRSHNFDVSYSEGVFTFEVYGYGHGVGLSQYGADFLARQDYTFEEILANYYTGATLKQVALSLTE